MSDMLNWLAGAVGGTYGNFIGGEWKPAGDKTSQIFNPADRDQSLGRFADSGAAEVDEAVVAAHKAWLSWRQVPGPDRGAILFRAADLLEQRIDELAFILAADTPVEVVVVLERWVKVREPAGAIAWIEAGRLAARRTVIVTAERATAFQNADAGSAVAFHATRDVVLELTQPAAGGWVGVRHRDGASGFLRVTEVWGL